MKFHHISPLSLAPLFLAAATPFLIAQDDGVDSIVDTDADTNTTISSQNRIVIRTLDGDGEHDEIVIEGESGDQAGLWKKIKDQLKESQIDEKTQNLVHEALEQANKKVHDAYRSAIILDENGERHEVELSNHGLADWVHQFGKKKPSIDSVWPDIAKALGRLGIDEETIKRARSLAESYSDPHKRHMIGVQCRKLDDILRSQMQLECGLVVEKVFPGTPAEEAGMEKHDILLEADNQPLNNVKDLIDAVQSAGIDEKQISVTFVRAGKKETRSMKTEPQGQHAFSRKAESFQQFGFPTPGQHPYQSWFDHYSSSSRAGDPSIEELEDTVASLQETIEELKDQIEEATAEENEVRQNQ